MSAALPTPTRSWASPPLWLAIGAALAHLAAVAFATDFGPRLELDRAAVAAGEWWRLLSGHFAHWTSAQLVWDGVVFAVLGGMCWRDDPRLFWRVLLGSALAVSAAVLILHPEVARYRGLSGIDAALFAALTITSARELWRERRFRALAGVGFAATSLSAKIAWEVVTQTALFAGDLGPGVVPLPLVHAMGAGVGVLLVGLGPATPAAAPARRRPPGSAPCRLPESRPRS